MGEIKPLFDETEIARRVDELAREIAETIDGDLTLIGVLKGSFVFLADLVRALNGVGRPAQVEFIRLSSYGVGTTSSGDVLLIGSSPAIDKNRTALLVDDIVDTGYSVERAQGILQANGIDPIWTCALLDKPSRREIAVEVDFVGFTIPDVFVAGYGIDYAENYRSLPFIGAVQLAGEFDIGPERATG